MKTYKKNLIISISALLLSAASKVFAQETDVLYWDDGMMDNASLYGGMDPGRNRLLILQFVALYIATPILFFIGGVFTFIHYRKKKKRKVKNNEGNNKKN